MMPSICVLNVATEGGIDISHFGSHGAGGRKSCGCASVLEGREGEDDRDVSLTSSLCRFERVLLLCLDQGGV
jgi:hypothetical protein